ncbi:PTS sugar transporter subunit IIA [Rhodoluna limnophila]|uniref:PTS sugar transporter subunit IIA n=1 Tax=Rhodoluna limnophila TaxID=232537 RepID=UPI001105FB58|nr:PTS sugar transporter subunit IIA [Rhodoluna limnophila]
MSNKAIELIRLVGVAKSRDEAISEVAEMLINAKAVTPSYRDAMFDRESSVSTYMGHYLAIPHGTLEGAAEVLHSALAIVRYEEPIDWDGNEVRFVIGIAGKDGTHMDSLAQIAQVFSELETVEKLLKVSTEEQVREIFAEQAAA